MAKDNLMIPPSAKTIKCDQQSELEVFKYEFKNSISAEKLEEFFEECENLSSLASLKVDNKDEKTL